MKYSNKNKLLIVHVQLVDISDDGFITLMDESGETRDDLKLPTFPDDLGPQIRAAFDDGKEISLSVLSACGIEQVIAMKEAAAEK